MRYLLLTLLAACAADPDVAAPEPSPDIPPVLALDTALTIVDGEAPALAWPCFDTPIALPADCAVEITYDGVSSYWMPPCGAGIDAKLCWHMETDAVACPGGEHSMLAVTNRQWPEGRYHLKAQCAGR